MDTKLPTIVQAGQDIHVSWPHPGEGFDCTVEEIQGNWIRYTRRAVDIHGKPWVSAGKDWMNLAVCDYISPVGE